MNVYIIKATKAQHPTIIQYMKSRGLPKIVSAVDIETLIDKSKGAYALFVTKNGQQEFQNLVTHHTPILLDFSSFKSIADLKNMLKSAIVLPGPAKKVSLGQTSDCTIPAGDPPRKIMVVITSGDMVMKQVQFLHSLNYKQLQVAGDNSDLEAKQGRFFYVITPDSYTEFIVALTKAARKQNYIVYDDTVPDESNFESFKDQILKMTPLVATITSQDQIAFYRNIVKSPLFTRDQRHAAEVALIEWDKKQSASNKVPLGNLAQRLSEFNKEPAPRTKIRLTNKFGSVLIGTFLEKRDDRLIVQIGGRDYSVPDTISTRIEEVPDSTPDIPPKPCPKSMLDREIDMLHIDLADIQAPKNISLDQVLDMFGVSCEPVDQYKYVPEADLIKYLNAGWSFVKELSGQKFLIMKKKEESK